MNNKIGVQVVYREDTDVKKEFEKAVSMELPTVQLCMWKTGMFNSEVAETVRRAAEETGVNITTLWAGWSGPCEWNFNYGPSTVGLVPAAYRDSRLAELMKASDFAEMIGVNKVETHVGFLPIDPMHPDFVGVVAALRKLCKYMKAKGQYFLFETGQETPVTLLRAIESIELDNVGINLDTANLVLYGMANTLDALDVFGKYVMETHVKDGFYPTDGMKIGHEAAVGQGKVDFPAVVKKLGELGFDGTFTIEREISGERQIKDIIKARDLLRQWMRSSV